MLLEWHTDLLFSGTESSALHVQPQEQKKQETLKTLKDTEEILIYFNFTWKINQSLPSSLSTEMWLFLRERVVKMLSVGEHEALCQNIPGVFDRCEVSLSASSVCRGAVDSSCITIWGLHNAFVSPLLRTPCSCLWNSSACGTPASGTPASGTPPQTGSGQSSAPRAVHSSQGMDTPANCSSC